MKEDELKQKTEENYRKHSKKLNTLWNGAIYSEGSLFGYRYAIKELREEIRTDNADVIANACKKITELAEENELLKTKLDALSDGVEWKEILAKNEQIKELQEQIVDLKDYVLKVSKFLHNHKIDTEKSVKLEVKAEQFLNSDGCPDVLCEDCTKDCEMKKIMEQANKEVEE